MDLRFRRSAEERKDLLGGGGGGLGSRTSGCKSVRLVVSVYNVLCRA